MPKIFFVWYKWCDLSNTYSNSLSLLHTSSLVRLELEQFLLLIEFNRTLTLVGLLGLYDHFHHLLCLKVDECKISQTHFNIGIVFLWNGDEGRYASKLIHKLVENYHFRNCHVSRVLMFLLPAVWNKTQIVTNPWWRLLWQWLQI